MDVTDHHQLRAVHPDGTTAFITSTQSLGAMRELLETAGFTVTWEAVPAPGEASHAC